MVDDAHWADPQTAAFLEQLCTEVSYARRHQPVLSVLSARSIDPDDRIGIVLERVDRMARSTAIDLAALTEIDLRDLLIGHGVPNPDRRFVAMMSEVSRGNPLFVREALRQIDARSAFRSVSGRTATRLGAQDLAPPASSRSWSIGVSPMSILRSPRCCRWRPWWTTPSTPT